MFTAARSIAVGRGRARSPPSRSLQSGGERSERGLPGLAQGVRRRLRRARGDWIRRDHLDRAVDPLGVEPLEQPPRASPLLPTTRNDSSRRPPLERLQRPEQLSPRGRCVGLLERDRIRASPHPSRQLVPGRSSPELHRRRTYTQVEVAKVEKRRALSEDRLRDFLREMLLIRRFEEKVEERFRAGELPGLPARRDRPGGGRGRRLRGDGGRRRLRARPIARTGTRSRAARTRTRVMAELYGKLEGCSHGYGGSMHLYDVERGNLGANAVVGGGLPAIVGAGLAFKLRDEPRVAVAFFGDGATNTGTFHESLNLAQLWKTKTLFVCENNEWAESTPGWQHSPVWDDMSKRALAYDMPLDQGRRPGRRGGLREGARGARARALRRRARSSSTSRLPHARPLHRRPAGLPLEGGSRRRPPSTTRSCACASGSRSPTRSGRRSRPRCSEIVEGVGRVREERHRPAARRRAQEHLCLS